MNRSLKLDGGLSTALEGLGLNLNTSLWTGELLRSNPKAIERAHRAFVDVGAEIIITSAYQISFSGCKERGWSNSEVTSALTLSTELAKSAADGNAKVAASVGPYGAALSDGSEYRGRYGVSNSKLREFHERRLEILISTEPDYLALETMPDMQEVEVLLELISEFNSGIPFWVSYSCNSELKTNAGQEFSEATELVNSHKDAFAVGVNCTAPNLINDLLKAGSSKLPYIVYPNAGREWDANRKEWSGPTSGSFSPDLIAEWIDSGAQIIGGCCGVSPKDIESINIP